MNHLINLIKKELRELITVSSMLPVIAIMIIFIVLGSAMGGEISEQTSVQPIGYADLTGGGEYSDNAIAYLETYYRDVYKVDVSKYLFDITDKVNPDDVEGTMIDAMRDKDVSTALLIPADFNEKVAQWESAHSVVKIYYAQEHMGIFSSLNTLYGTQAVTVINRSVTDSLILDNTELTEEQVAMIQSVCYYTSSTYLNGELHSGITPDQIYSAVSGQNTFIPIIIMIVIVMIGSIVISSMGNEKENKTMETLLTLPINRTTIVTGKLIGASLAGLIMCAFYMVGMYFYIGSMSSLGGQGGVSADDLGLTLSALDWILVAVMMFVTILCALGMCMLLGAFAKNYKTAQMYVAPISVLAIIPMFVTMFSSFGDLPLLFQGILFIIPFTHPMMAVQNLMFDNIGLVLAGLVYVILFAVMIIFITVRVYKSDILLTGVKFRKKGSEEKE